MALPEWHIAVKLAEQPLAPKSILRLPETELGECPLGGCSISHLKQLITGKLQESMPDPELIGACPAGAWRPPAAWGHPRPVLAADGTRHPAAAADAGRARCSFPCFLGIRALQPRQCPCPGIFGLSTSSVSLAELSWELRERSALTQVVILPSPLDQLCDFPPDSQLHEFPVLFPSQLLQLLNNPWGSKAHLETPSWF